VNPSEPEDSVGVGHPAESAPPAAIGPVLDAFKGALDRQFTLADRLTTKARQAFVVSIGFFTIVQTVAFNNFQSDFVKGNEIKWLLALAIAAIVGLAAAATAVIRSDQPVEFGDFKLSELGDLVSDAYAGDDHVPGRLAETYYTIVEILRESNVRRDRFYKWTVYAAGASIFVSSVELISALAFRIP
jgi:hypothetical protein